MPRGLRAEAVIKERQLTFEPAKQIRIRVQSFFVSFPPFPLSRAASLEMFLHASILSKDAIGADAEYHCARRIYEGMKREGGGTTRREYRFQEPFARDAEFHARSSRLSLRPDENEFGGRSGIPSRRAALRGSWTGRIRGFTIPRETRSRRLITQLEGLEADGGGSGGDEDDERAREARDLITSR